MNTFRRSTNRICAVIPVFNPEPGLLPLVDSLCMRFKMLSFCGESDFDESGMSIIHITAGIQETCGALQFVKLVRSMCPLAISPRI